MYNFGRVTRDSGPERYCDSSEMGMIWDGFGAFPSKFITQVSGNQVRKSGQKSARSAVTRSVTEFATKFPSCNSIPSALGERDDRNLRLAPKAKRQGDCSDASIDIQLHAIAHTKQPVHVLSPHIR
jgi:hypothetical protein